ncbi:MAG: hypothetical protein AAF958_03935 [Planctomycetota bacterium]
MNASYGMKRSLCNVLTPAIPIRSWIRVTVWILATLVLLQASADAQNRISPRKRDAAETLREEVTSIGIDGICRIGRMTRVELPDAPETPNGPGDGAWRIETRDGDGVRVRYQRSLTTHAASSGASDTVSGKPMGYARPGAQAAPLNVYFGDQQIRQGRFPVFGSVAERPVMINEVMPWVVAFGDPLGLDQIGVDLRGGGPKVAVSRVQSAASLPDDALGWEGVDLVTVNAVGVEGWGRLSDAQSGALVDWVRGGGYMLLHLGESTPTLLAGAPWLRDLLPLDDFKTVDLRPDALETATVSQNQLPNFRGVKLDAKNGTVLIYGQTNRRENVPLAVRYPAGLGHVAVVAADLESPIFANWPERKELVHQLTDNIAIPEGSRDAVRVGTAYQDLGGQMRIALDQPRRRGQSFAFIALAMLGLLALIGPLDYWLLNRVLGRPLLGWLSFPLMVAGLGGLVYWQYRGDGSADPFYSRRVEVVDLDLINHRGRVRSLEVIASTAAILVDTRTTAGDAVQGLGLTGRDAHGPRVLPIGHPGEAFGGLRLLIEDERLPSYRVELGPAAIPTASTGSNAQVDAGSSDVSIVQLPLAPRSSKFLETRWDFHTPESTGGSLQRRSGSKFLSGGLVNPVNVDLLEGRLIYQGWMYHLPTRLPVGGRINEVKSLRQEEHRWLLTRREPIEGSSRGEAWKPGDVDDTRRILEVMLFHKAAGGTDYTRLRSRVLDSLDFSDLSDPKRCILMGRLEQPLLDRHYVSDGDEMAVAGETESVLRMVMPVETIGITQASQP